MLVIIKHGNREWGVPPHPLHDETDLTGQGQFLVGGYTLLYYREGNVVHSYSETEYMEPGTGPDDHTEIQYVEEVEEEILRELMRDALGVIIEICQINSPCTRCQKYLTSKVNAWKQSTRKKVIVRASARDAYESHGGAIFEGNQKIRHGYGDPGAHPHMDNLVNIGYVGIHKYMEPPY